MRENEGEKESKKRGRDSGERVEEKKKKKKKKKKLKRMVGMVESTHILCTLYVDQCTRFCFNQRIFYFFHCRLESRLIEKIVCSILPRIPRYTFSTGRIGVMFSSSCKQCPLYRDLGDGRDG